MEMILKKAELVNTNADSVVVILLTEKIIDKVTYYLTETHLYNTKGNEISQSTKFYLSYRIAAEKYSSLISMLN